MTSRRFDYAAYRNTRVAQFQAGMPIKANYFMDCRSGQKFPRTRQYRRNQERREEGFLGAPFSAKAQVRIRASLAASNRTGIRA